MRSITLIFNTEPKAIQSVRSAKRGKFIQHYQPQHNTDWKAYIRYAAQQQLPKGWKLLDGTLAIGNVIFIYSPITTLTREEFRLINLGKIVLKDTKPDLSDNLFKGLLDSLEGVIYTNDSRIALHDGKVLKGYAKIPPCIKIQIRELDSNIIDMPDFNEQSTLELF